MEIIKITSLSKLHSLNNFFHQKNINKNYFQSYDFISSYLNFNNKDFTIYIIKHEYNFIILPLNLMKYKKVNVFSFLGTPFISEENDAIHNINNFKKFEEMMVFFFNKEKIKFFFNNIKEGYLNDFLKKYFTIIEYFSSNCILLQKESGIIVDELISKNSKNFNYIFRKFEKDYKQNISKIKIEDLNKDLIENLNIEKFILDNKKIKIKNYYKNMIKFWIYLSKKNLAKINILKTEELIISLVITVKFYNKIYYIVPCYNQNLNKYSFGKYHLYELVKLSKSENIDYFFLGPGNENYKKEFLQNNYKLYNYTNSTRLKIYYFFKKMIYAFIN